MRRDGIVDDQRPLDCAVQCRRNVPFVSDQAGNEIVPCRIDDLNLYTQLVRQLAQEVFNIYSFPLTGLRIAHA